MCGVWLHARQDRWAHGLEAKNDKLKHGKKADNIWYDWKYKNGVKAYKKLTYGRSYKDMKKLVTKNKRFKTMIEDTIKFLSKAKKSIERSDMYFFSTPSSKKSIYKRIARYLSKNN